MKCCYLLLLGLAACHPRIYRYEVSATDLGLNDSYSVSWATRGSTYLTIHDTSMPYTAAAAVVPVKLLVSRDGKTDTVPLVGADTLRLPEEGSLSIRNLPNGDSTARFRYMKLVAHKYDKDSTRETQISFYSADGVSSVGFIANARGDSVVAEGDKDAARWGDLFRILAVSNDTSSRSSDEAERDLVVTHAGITAVLHPGDTPSFVFNNTPIGGWWSIRSPMTGEEKAGRRKTPGGLQIRIIIKHI